MNETISSSNRGYWNLCKLNPIELVIQTEWRNNEIILDIFKDTKQFKKSYAFNIKKGKDVTEVNIPEGLSKFNEISLRYYFKWFIDFYNKVKMQGLYRRETCMTLECVISPTHSK